MKSYSIILLAAGSSSRFGSPKQLAKIGLESFIQHAISESIKITGNAIVVLGANYDAIKKDIQNFPVELEYNKDWEEGMSSSIRCGLSASLNRDPLTEAVIFVVCDQPFLSSEIIEELIEKYESTKKPIIACSYNKTAGTPVLFDKKYFDALLNLKGPSGAKEIILQNEEETARISFPLGSVDIDTKDDYNKLLNKSS